jgi:hypothetical protein
VSPLVNPISHTACKPKLCLLLRSSSCSSILLFRFIFHKTQPTNTPNSIYYCVILGFNIHSCFITPEEREEILERREERRIEKEFEEEIMKTPSMIPMTPGSMPRGPGMVPRTPGIPPMAVGGSISPFAPRHLAFNRLGNGSTSSDLPLRNNPHSHDQYPSQPQSQTVSPESQTGSPMYFPPPPKKAAKT